jgi:hypothetical protein
MGGKKRQKQNPVICDHCKKTFGSGAGVAMHMKWVNGKIHPMTGKKLEGDHLKAQQDRMNKARQTSPTAKVQGKRITLKCECGTLFEVTPSAAKRRKYCSKSCLATFTPRGPLSEEQKLAISKAQKKRYKENPESNPFYGRTPTNYNGWGHGGFCEELGFHVRSTWERDYLISLKEAAIIFTYEPKRFDLGKGRGTYLPDIQITETDFIEITGWDKPGKAEKRKLFCEVYPDFTLHVINEAPSDRTKKELIDYVKEVVGE